MSLAESPAKNHSSDRTWVRPLVRYVDEEQAVVDTHVFLKQSQAASVDRRQRRDGIDVLIQIKGADGRSFERRTHLSDDQVAGMVRVELVSPQRWWPAGMGGQDLYQLSVALVCQSEVIDTWQTTIGLTSVRTDTGESDVVPPTLLVNGRACEVHNVVPVDPVDEEHLLAVGSDSILFVRHHFGPDVLYHAADRAGLLLVQGIPDPAKDPRTDLRTQVDRLACHPSLAGYFIDAACSVSNELSAVLREMDPTRRIFRALPWTESHDLVA